MCSKNCDCSTRKMSLSHSPLNYIQSYFRDLHFYTKFAIALTLFVKELVFTYYGVGIISFGINGTQPGYSFLCVTTYIIGLCSIISWFKLSLPSGKYVDSIFGPDVQNSVSDLHNGGVGGCQCHSITHSDYTLYNQSSKISNLHKHVTKTIPISMQDHSHFIIGHRGAGLNAPENSLSAIKKCAARGCKMVEFDVSLTKDFVPVLFHDDNLLRITGVDRRISEITWNELKVIDISDKFPGERVPTLEEAVETCLALGLRFIIDIKDEHEQLIDAIVKIFQRNKEQAYSKGVVSSFYFRVIYKIRARDSNIVGCMAWRPLFFALPPVFKKNDGKFTKYLRKLLVSVMYTVNDIAMHYLYTKVLGLSAILVHKDALNKELVHTLRQKGLRVYAWTVNCPMEKQYLLNKLQVGYLTDTLDAEDCSLPAPERWLCNNNNNEC